MAAKSSKPAPAAAAPVSFPECVRDALRFVLGRMQHLSSEDTQTARDYAAALADGK